MAKVKSLILANLIFIGILLLVFFNSLDYLCEGVNCIGYLIYIIIGIFFYLAMSINLTFSSQTQKNPRIKLWILIGIGLLIVFILYWAFSLSVKAT